MKKEEKKASGTAKGKLAALAELHKMASSMMGDSLHNHMEGMKKVAVMAKDNHGLEDGLDKAKSVVHQMPEHDGMPGNEMAEHDARHNEEDEEDYA